MRVPSRPFAVATAALLAATLLSACGSDSADDPAAAQAAADAAAASAAPGAGALAAASPVVADIQNMKTGTEIEVPVAPGFPLILQVDNPDDWKFEVTQKGKIVVLHEPDKDSPDPHLAVEAQGEATVVARNTDGTKIITLNVKGVPGPGDAPAEAVDVPTTAEESADPAADPDRDPSQETTEKAPTSLTDTTPNGDTPAGVDEQTGPTAKASTAADKS